MGQKGADWSPWLVVFALLVAVPGWLFHYSRRGSDFASFYDDIYPEAPWAYLLWATLILASFALVLTLAGWIVSLRTNERSSVDSAVGRQPIAQTVEEVRRHIMRISEDPDPDIALAIDEVLRGGLLIGASDIHYNPVADGLRITYRVDGVLFEVVTVMRQIAARLVGRIKVLAHLDPYALTAQDGSLRRRVGEVELEARVSCLPANHGERLVLRLVRAGTDIVTISELGFSAEISAMLEELFAKPQGILYVSGPVGSGKTTTLYAALAHIHKTRGETTSLVSLEDPIELQLPFATQTQVNQKAGMTFAHTLRSVLRQDPGALMLGEVRDRETAAIATQAGLTGHLILTTVHVQSAAGTFARLIEMDIEPFVLASSCLGSLAQRLVRALCVECRKPQELNANLRERFSSLGINGLEGDFYEPVGCQYCEGRGYVGRLPVAELLVMNESLRAAVLARQPSEAIERLAVESGMVPLLHSALERARRGETSLMEVLRVAG